MNESYGVCVCVRENFGAVQIITSQVYKAEA